VPVLARVLGSLLDDLKSKEEILYWLVAFAGWAEKKGCPNLGPNVDCRICKCAAQCYSSLSASSHTHLLHYYSLLFCHLFNFEGILTEMVAFKEFVSGSSTSVEFLHLFVKVLYYAGAFKACLPVYKNPAIPYELLSSHAALAKSEWTQDYESYKALLWKFNRSLCKYMRQPRAGYQKKDSAPCLSHKSAVLLLCTDQFASQKAFKDYVTSDGDCFQKEALAELIAELVRAKEISESGYTESSGGGGGGELESSDAPSGLYDDEDAFENNLVGDQSSSDVSETHNASPDVEQESDELFALHDLDAGEVLNCVSSIDTMFPENDNNISKG